jgi:hypothetical protein
LCSECYSDEGFDKINEKDFKDITVETRAHDDNELEKTLNKLKKYYLR